MNCTPFSLAALICVVVSRAVALTCLSCTDSARPRDCEYVQECGSHEQCSIESYLTTSGYITYSVGCMDGLKCAAAGRKRAVLNATLLNKIQQTNDFSLVLEEHADPNNWLLCTECCDTELCNIKGCGEQGLPPNSGPLCYACEQELAPNRCNKITLCGSDKSCRLSMRRVGVDFVYRSDCVYTYECQQLGVLDIGAYQLVGRRDADVISRFERSATCNKCCSKNLCNSDNCTSLTYPTTTFPTTIVTTQATTTLAPVNGGWGTWSHWNICSLTCGGGRHYRIRVCNNPTPANGGAFCIGTNRETQTCNDQPCAVNGGWGTWSHWNICSLTCGGGQHYRVRICDNPTPANGGALCSGSNRETQSCNDHACAVDGKWSEWGLWSVCTATCGSSATKLRTRTCSNPTPSSGGANCNGTASDAASCHLSACQVDGNWSDWGSWSACTATCGSSVTRSRLRTCSNPAPSTGGANCMGTASVAESCNLGACQVDGNWSDWGHWSACLSTCGSTVTRSRSRTCTNPAPSPGGANCMGTASDSESCNLGACPVDGNWSDWVHWSSCTATCGSSVTRSRSRTCTNPAPSPGGANCMGTASDSESCNLGTCPVDGNWSDWGHWSACVMTCGSSVTRSRSRTCTNPAPSPGGANCMGTMSDSESCNLGACPVDGNWSDWGYWTACAATCGSFVTRSRSRTCTNPAPSPGGANCAGTASDAESCNLSVCPVDGQWSLWTTWGACSETCGTGISSRQRSCDNPRPSTNGKDCIGQANEILHCSGLNGPQIIRSAQNFTRPMGSRVVIDCLVLGNTPTEQVPKVIWTAPQINGQTLPSNVVELRNGSIFIDGLTLANIGAYSCTFNNDCGSHNSANFWVNIQ